MEEFSAILTRVSAGTLVRSPPVVGPQTMFQDWHSRQPIRCQVWKSLLTDMDFNMEIF